MLVLKKMNIHILFTHWFLSDFPFLTEELLIYYTGCSRQKGILLIFQDILFYNLHLLPFD